jgi:hypothetical protein
MSAKLEKTTTNTQVHSIKRAIEKTNSAQLDALWAVLKYKEIGIYRKIQCISDILNISFDDMVNELPQSEGRLLDKQTRKIIHNALIERSNNK